MRYLIVSDMHGNWDAFSAVLRKVRRKRFDKVLVLGDLVGYGAAPNQVVDAVRELSSKSLAVRGNHDKVVAGIEDGANFNEAALQAARWTAATLTAENLRYLQRLAEGPLEADGQVSICHGSPVDEDAYVFSDQDAWQIFSTYPGRVIFFGHTHIPSVFARPERGPLEFGVVGGDGGALRLQPEVRYLLNPGSIGQPRNRDPRAAFMTYDSDKQLVRWIRARYPVDRAQKRIVRAGLPKILADRLSVGV